MMNKDFCSSSKTSKITTRLETQPQLLRLAVVKNKEKAPSDGDKTFFVYLQFSE